jgi:hypothetical protein
VYRYLSQSFAGFPSTLRQKTKTPRGRGTRLMGLTALSLTEKKYSDTLREFGFNEYRKQTTEDKQRKADV